MEIVESAIYIDFDNIYSRLIDAHGEEIAINFVYSAKLWTDFLAVQGLEKLCNNDEYKCKRIFRKKVVYLNPNSFGRYRTPFTKSGYRVIDCPPLTMREKTATDIHMAVDIINDTYQKPYKDYFILSGDADFSPLLFHINEMSKNSILLGIGFISPMYESVASHQINEIDFITIIRDYTVAKKNADALPLARIISNPKNEETEKECIVQVNPEIKKKRKKDTKIFNSFSDLASSMEQKKSDISGNIQESNILKKLGLPAIPNTLYNAIFDTIISYIERGKDFRYVTNAILLKKYDNITLENIKIIIKYVPYSEIKENPNSIKSIFAKNCLKENVLTDIKKEDILRFFG